MKIYIASSWRNAHGVELLTAALREKGHEVLSWIENNFGENHNHVTKAMDFEQWVKSPESDQSFQYDTRGAMFCDIFIYYGPAGQDAAAELGLCYSTEYIVPERKIYGLWAKGETLGLMRKMVDKWFDRPQDLLAAIPNEKSQIHMLQMMMSQKEPIINLRLPGENSEQVVKLCNDFRYNILCLSKNREERWMYLTAAPIIEPISMVKNES